MILTKPQVLQLLKNLNAAARDFKKVPEETRVEIDDNTLIVSMQPPKREYGLHKPDAPTTHEKAVHGRRGRKSKVEPAPPERAANVLPQVAGLKPAGTGQTMSDAGPGIPDFEGTPPARAVHQHGYGCKVRVPGGEEGTIDAIQADGKPGKPLTVMVRVGKMMGSQAFYEDKLTFLCEQVGAKS